MEDPIDGRAGEPATHAGARRHDGAPSGLLPVVVERSPKSGPQTGGTAVMIYGSGFTGATSVKFGSTPAKATVLSWGWIRAVSPPGSGTVDVTVTTPNGTSAPSVKDRFKYKR